jgi:hypothetical protein
VLHIRGVQGHLHHQLLEEGQLHPAPRQTGLLLVKGPVDWRGASGPASLSVQKKRALQPVVRYEDLDSVLTDEEDVSVLVADASLEEDVGVEVDGGAARVLRHPMAVVDVLGNFLRGLLVHEVGVGGVRANGDGQKTVNNDVGIASNGRCEMSVDGTGQAVVPENRKTKLTNPVWIKLKTATIIQTDLCVIRYLFQAIGQDIL